MKLFNLLQTQFPHLPWLADEPWSKHNPLGIGGPAEVFVEIRSNHDLIAVVQFAQQNQIPRHILGWGANTLVSDQGLAGLVIKNSVTEIVIEPTPDQVWPESPLLLPHRYGNTYQEFDQIDYDETSRSQVRVDISTGTPLPYAINYLISHGVTGLQWFVRIPASIGGAIYNNIHGGKHFMSEYLVGVTTLRPTGEIKRYLPSQLDFSYDASIFHHNHDLILTGHFLLTKGDVAKAKTAVEIWSSKKAHQPARSLGCIFQNLTPEQQKSLDLPTPSAAYVIEHKLQLKGYKLGDCQISMAHAAFIENIGQGTAQDYLALIKLIKTRAQTELGLTLQPEIFFKGFTKSELSGII